jgi:hypothetical protein
MTQTIISQTTFPWVTASEKDELSFYNDEKERHINEDCKHRLKGGQCILRAKHLGTHIVSFNKAIIALLITNNILVKMMQSNWRVW